MIEMDIIPKDKIITLIFEDGTEVCAFWDNKVNGWFGYFYNNKNPEFIESQQKIITWKDYKIG